MQEESVIRLTELRVDGGATRGLHMQDGALWLDRYYELDYPELGIEPRDEFRQLLVTSMAAARDIVLA